MKQPTPIVKLKAAVKTRLSLRPKSSTRIKEVTKVPAQAPKTLDMYKKLNPLLLEESLSLMNCMARGKVAPMRKHQGKRDTKMTRAEKKR